LVTVVTVVTVAVQLTVLVMMYPGPGATALVTVMTWDLGDGGPAKVFSLIFRNLHASGSCEKDSNPRIESQTVFHWLPMETRV
jgi:hypothetical protein